VCRVGAEVDDQRTCLLELAACVTKAARTPRVVSVSGQAVEQSMMGCVVADRDDHTCDSVVSIKASLGLWPARLAGPVARPQRARPGA
jgi:hypothetical protein